MNSRVNLGFSNTKGNGDFVIARADFPSLTDDGKNVRLPLC